MINRQGFTLIEMMVVIGIFLVVAGASVPLFTFFQSDSVIDSAQSELIQNLRLTQLRAKAGENASSFGVYFSGASYTMYEGNSYAARNTIADRVFLFPDHITSSGMIEINFSIKTGLPDQSGTITVSQIETGDTLQVQINSIGLISSI